MPGLTGWKPEGTVPLEKARKIVILLPHFRRGGAENVMVRIANGLADRGIDVHFCGLSPAGDLRDDLDERVTINDLGVSRVRYAGPGLLRYLRQKRPDVVLSTLGRLNTLLLLLRPMLGRMRIFVREANTPSVDLQEGSHSRLTLWLMPHAYRQANTIICQSQAMLTDVSATYHISPSHLAQIYNPVPIDHIRQAISGADNPFSPGSRNIVFCGRFSRQKGVDILMRAFASLADRIENVRLHLLGEGEDEDALKSLAADLAITGSIEWWGFREDRYRFFHYADLVVSSSRWEGLPNVLLEALSAGAKIVATDCPGGTREILEMGQVGELVEKEHPEALAAAIQRALTSPSVSESEIDKVLSRFRQSRIIDEYLATLFPEQVL